MKRRSDEEISAPLYEYDAAIRAQYGFFAGVDEACLLYTSPSPRD